MSTSESLIFLLAGQSNMSGRGELAEVATLQDPRVYVSHAGMLEVAAEPLHRDSDAAVGPGMSFAIRVIDAVACDRVILVPCAVGGTWIERWQPDGDLFCTAVEEANAAGRHGRLAGVLWHQGESDAQTPVSASVYGRRLKKVIGGFRRQLNSPDVPFLAGEIGHFLDGYPSCSEFERVNRAIHEVCGRVDHCSVVGSAGLGHTGDHLHFDAHSARRLGERYAEAWLRLAV